MRLSGLAFPLLLSACQQPPRAGTDNSPYSVAVRVAPKRAIDLLFLVDNSNSMEAMQETLRNNFYEFFRPFDDLAAKGTYSDFHIGVVTSDYGAGATGAPGCQPSTKDGGGDQGRLIALGKVAAKGCQAPLGGVPFIRYAYGPGGDGISNLPPGQGLAETFTCMASVGATGCGFEHQLEAVHAALRDTGGANAGFLREEAALAVVFLTNEDDASAPPDTDVFDKNRVDKYGYEASYTRQTRFAVQCGDPPEFPPYGDSGGPLAGCRPAPNPDSFSGPGRQWDVRRYVDFFTRPKAHGGVKSDPLDVILYAIDAPEEPFEVILSNPGTASGAPYIPCRAVNDTTNPPCVPVLQHSCVNPRNTGLFGDPAVRLNTVVRAAPYHRVWSICESAYGEAMRDLADVITDALTGGCLPAEALGAAGSPDEVDCRVSDVLEDVDRETSTDIPRCAEGVVPPCWLLEIKSVCGARATGGLGLTIERGGQEPPPMTRPRAHCLPRP